VSDNGAAARDASRAVQRLPGDPAAAEALERLGLSLGWRVARIELAGCHEKECLLERVAVALEFPDWFGHNWDAFFDCLTDLEWRRGPGQLLVLEHVGGLRSRSPEVFDTAILILGDVAEAWERRGVPFRAFLID
jgi:RNAse (barnase) inhibitor barstar